MEFIPYEWLTDSLNEALGIDNLVEKTKDNPLEQSNLITNMGIMLVFALAIVLVIAILLVLRIFINLNYRLYSIYKSIDSRIFYNTFIRYIL